MMSWEIVLDFIQLIVLARIRFQSFLLLCALCASAVENIIGSVTFLYPNAKTPLTITSEGGLLSL